MARPDRIIKSLVRTEFIITNHRGQTFKGLLVEADATTIVLANAEAVTPDGTHTPADGHIYLPRADVAYMQRT